MEFKQRFLESLAVTAAAVVFGGTAFGRTSEIPAPVPTHATAPVPSRTWEQAAPVGSAGAPNTNLPAPIVGGGDEPGGGGGSTTPPGGVGGPYTPPGGGNPSDLDTTSEVDPGEPPSQTSNDRAATPPGQPPQFPPIGGGGGGQGGGGGEAPQPPQFQQIPAAGVAQFAALPQEADLTAALTAATGQISKALDGSALTAMTDKIGQDMAKFQESLFGIINTNTATIRQGIANTAAQSMNQPSFNQPNNFSGAVSGVGAQVANSQPRTGETSTQRSGGGATPRTSQPVVTEQVATRTPASTPSMGQRGRIDSLGFGPSSTLQ